LNCQGQQQAKLIDFLQSRVEELEPDKKKKKVIWNQGICDKFPLPSTRSRSWGWP